MRLAAIVVTTCVVATSGFGGPSIEEGPPRRFACAIAWETPVPISRLGRLSVVPGDSLGGPWVVGHADESALDPRGSDRTDPESWRIRVVTPDGVLPSPVPSGAAVDFMGAPDPAGGLRVVWSEPDSGFDDPRFEANEPWEGTLFSRRWDGTEWSAIETVHVSDGMQGGYHSTSRLRTSPDGSIHFTIGARQLGIGGRMFVRWTSGEGWRVTPVVNSVLHSVGAAGNYDEAVVTAGVVHRVASHAAHRVHPRPPGPDRNSLVYTRSSDGGKEWDDPVVVIRGGDEHPTFEPHLHRSRDGTFHAVVTRVRSGGGGPTPEVWYVRSEDSGETWSDPEQIALHPGRWITKPLLLEDPDGGIRVVYTHSQHSGIAEYVLRSDDGSWSDPARFLPGRSEVSTLGIAQSPPDRITAYYSADAIGHVMTGRWSCAG